MFLNKKASLGLIILTLAISLISINIAHSATNNTTFIFNNNLKLGSNNNDVKQLQKYLNNNGFIVAKVGPGSLNKETTFFGRATQASLIKFQQANKIKPSVGYFGPLTRDYINKKNKLANNQPNNNKIGNTNNQNNNINNNNENNNNNNQADNKNNNNNNNDSTYTIGGIVTGLAWPIVIENNTNKETITVSPQSNSEFIFPTKQNTNTDYLVTIKESPLNQKCYIKDNLGTITNTNITNIKIACGPNLYFNPFTFNPNSSLARYDLSYAAGANGYLTGATSQSIVSGQNATTVTAIPNEGYYFTTWSDGILTAARTDTNIIANKSVTANFAINTYTITSSAGANGTITPINTVNYGSNITYTITPDEGYLIEDILVDSVSVGTDSTYTFTNVTANHTISATFVVSSCGGVNSVSYGGQVYSTVSIGSQCWFGENLNIGTKVNSGNSEPACHDISGDDSGYWSCQVNNSVIEKYCYSNSDTKCTTDGGLYEWAETMNLPYDCNNATGTDNGNGTYTLTCPTSGNQTIQAKHQGICPTGWHIPSLNEYQTLAQVSDPGCNLSSYGSCSTAGTKLKASASHSPIAWNGTDIYNYSALPSGFRDDGGWFTNRSGDATLWSSVPSLGSNPFYAWHFLLYTWPDARGTSNNRIFGYSVRCLKD